MEGACGSWNFALAIRAIVPDDQGKGGIVAVENLVLGGEWSPGFAWSPWEDEMGAGEKKRLVTLLTRTSGLMGNPDTPCMPYMLTLTPKPPN